MDMPPQSSLVYYTLESPWPVALLLIAAGLLVLRVGIGRRDRRMSVISMLVVLGGPALILFAGYFETKSEMLQRRTREFVEVAVHGDRVKAASFLTDDLMVIVGHNGTRLTKEDILRQIAPITLIIETNRIREVLGVATDRDHGESLILQTTVARAGYPTPNRWRFHWVRDEVDHRWRIRQLIWEEWGIGKIPTEDMLRGMSGP